MTAKTKINLNRETGEPKGQFAATPTRRNKGFDVTHDAIIAATVQLISEKGPEAVTVAAVARSAGVDRKTLYYHFRDRDALLASAKNWSSQQLARGLTSGASRAERTAHISRFVLENPELIKLWFDDFIAPGDIRERYPQWDALVEGMKANLAHHEGRIDAELYCTIMLTAAYIAPRVYHNSVRPDLSIEEIVERFAQEQTRILEVDARLPEEK